MNPNIVKVLETSESRDKIIIVMELCTTDLHSMKNEIIRKNLPEDLVKHIAKQIIQGFY